MDGHLGTKPQDPVRDFFQSSAPMMLNGTPIRESVLAVQSVPIRKHKKRRNQTEQYHRRIQKKWRKRFGEKAVPCAFVIDNSMFGKTLIVHPSIMAQIKAGAFAQIKAL